jgi:2-hydroxy-6-oxonona-2,4-dienedioate hydrolase
LHHRATAHYVALFASAESALFALRVVETAAIWREGYMKTIRYIGIVLLLVLAGGVIWISVQYQRDIRAAREQVMAGGQVIETACGPIEYAEIGSGPPVLVLHGAGGGYDQGLLSGSWLLGDGYRLIAPSRFGYLNSPVPADSSLEAQAGAYACLLDTLEIEQVAVVGISAGGLSSLHFATRYPERSSALILVSAVSYADNPAQEEVQTASIVKQITSSDFVAWLAMRAAPATFAALLGVPQEVQARLTPEGRAEMHQVLDLLLPMSMRMEGLDLDQNRFCPRDFPLREIITPTLVIHARDDGLVGYEYGQHSAQNIPNTQLITIEEGGHFLLGHYGELRAATRAFLAQRVVVAP